MRVPSGSFRPSDTINQSIYLFIYPSIYLSEFIYLSVYLSPPRPAAGQLPAPGGWGLPGVRSGSKQSFFCIARDQ